MPRFETTREPCGAIRRALPHPEDPVEFDLSQLSGGDVYKLLVSCVVPRPIAFVTTVDRAGTVNAAPFSYFNLMGHAPPIVALGIGDRARHRPKDTARNIADTGELVINLVDEALGEKMAQCATDFPPEVDELAVTGLTPVASQQVAPPRVAESPIHLECRHHSTTTIGGTRIVLARVVHLHLRDDLVDAARRRVHTHEAHLLGRMHGRDQYTTTRDLVTHERLDLATWLARHGEP